MKRGDLVPDQTVLDLIAERTGCLRCEAGFLLDGFPRTAPQAEAFAKIMERGKISLDAVLNYELPIGKIVARLSGRRTCPKCKAVFHVTTLPPRVEGICDHCGTKLEQREDDRPEAVRVRMEVYDKSTKPLIDFYRKRGLLLTIEASGTPEEIYQRTLAALGSLRGS
jgi:adenylate kinase